MLKICNQEHFCYPLNKGLGGNWGFEIFISNGRQQKSNWQTTLSMWLKKNNPSSPWAAFRPQHMLRYMYFNLLHNIWAMFATSRNFKLFELLMDCKWSGYFTISLQQWLASMLFRLRLCELFFQLKCSDRLDFNAMGNM